MMLRMVNKADDNDDDEKGEEEIDRRGNGFPVLNDTLEEWREPAILHLVNILIIIVIPVIVVIIIISIMQLVLLHHKITMIETNVIMTRITMT